MATKILVVGASSGVGLQTVRAMLAEPEKFQVYALARDQSRTATGIGYGSSHARFVRGDVTKAETLPAACRGMDVVICSVTARDGWRLPCMNEQTPKYVDYKGVKSLAGAAFAEQVKRFVLISCTGVEHPFRPTSFCLNLWNGRILYWKYWGEEALKDVYWGEQGYSYYIIRPGKLTNEDGGQKGISLGQDDRKMGSSSRADVATVAIACAEGKNRHNVATFEIVNSTNPADFPPDHIQDLFRFILPDQPPDSKKIYGL